MRKKLFIILSLSLLLASCKSNDEYKPGNISNKEDTRETQAIETEETGEITEITEITEIAEIVETQENTNKETSEEDRIKEIEREVEVKKELELSRARRLNEPKKREVEKDLEKGKEDAPKEVNENIDNLLTQLIDISNNSVVEGHNFEEEGVIKVANDILYGQRQQAYELMKNVKDYGFNPHLTKAKKFDEENYTIEITFKKNDEDMIIYSGYYNEAINMFSIRNSYSTEAGSKYVIDYYFREGDGI